MNLKESKIILNKINLLFENLMVDDKISNIERDLMLSYIRQFYDGFLSNNVNSSPKIVVEDEIVEEETTTFVAPTPTVEPVKEKVTYKKPTIIKIPDSLKEYTSKPETNNQYQPPVQESIPEPVVSAPSVNQSVATQEANQTAQANIDPKFSELFEFSSSNEVSDKLSALPISDLKKSIGLNEKILTINDLYDGDHRLFDKSLDILNSFSSFDEAKAYIAENLAAKFDWTNPLKVKKAKIFIKLIKRRYN